MKNLLMLQALLISLIGCETKEFEIPFDKKECPIEYSLSTATNYQLTRHWNLIGLQFGYELMRYPPCTRYEGDNKFEVTITFSDTVHNYQQRHPYRYPLLFTGRGPANSYSGSYKIELSAKDSILHKIFIDGIISTLM